MLSYDFHLLLCLLISSCDQSCGVLLLGILFGVKQNHFNISQYTIESCSRLSTYEYPQNPVSQSNVAHVLLMIAHSLPTMI